MDNTNAINRLMRVSARVFARHDPVLGAEIKSALACIRTCFAPKSDRGLVPPTNLADDADASNDAPLRCIAECAHMLYWRRPGFGQLPSEISGSILVTEILGPDGMLKYDGLRFGALYQAAGHHYPEHNHSAEEVYYVVRGTGLWSIDGSPPVERGAGAFIHHAPSVMHSIETLDQPLLTLWVWHGDIDAQSYRLK